VLSAYPVVGCAYFIAAIFVVSALSKVRSRASVVEFLGSTASVLQAFRRRRGTGRSITRFFGFAVIAAEAATLVLVVIPATRVVGFGVACVLLLGFSVGIVVTLRSGASVPCRCFGASSGPVAGRHLVRNCVLMVVAVGGLVAQVVGPEGSVTPAGLAVAVSAAIVVALFVIRLDDLIDLFWPSAALRGRVEGTSR
jgi:hypothetical protein